MPDTRTLLMLPGDGIGPEVMAEVERVVHWFIERRDLPLTLSRGLVGGAALDAEGLPISDETLERARLADAILFGAVGGPRYDRLPFAMKPEQSILRLRRDLCLFANLRPAVCFDALVDASTLKPEIVSGLDLMIVRELTAGLYFGEPRGIFDDDSGGRVGINTQRYTTEEIRRVARAAFELARERRGRLCSMDKANVMEAGELWREEVQWVHDEEFPDVALSHLYADNGAMQLVREPKQFDVIVTDNVFGDLLSDCAAMLAGSLGMLPSASLGAVDEHGRRAALYEPVHGSAPDIAGQDRANPIAGILSFAMALRYSFDREDDARRIERAVEAVLAEGIRTADLLPLSDRQPVGCVQMGDAIIQALEADLHA